MLNINTPLCVVIFYLMVYLWLVIMLAHRTRLFALPKK